MIENHITISNLGIVDDLDLFFTDSRDLRDFALGIFRERLVVRREFDRSWRRAFFFASKFEKKVH